MWIATKAILVLLACAAATPLFADSRDVASWFRSETRARPYLAVEPDVLRVFDDAERAGLPTSPLLDKLKEGASKRVAPQRLLGALSAEAQRLSVGGAIFVRQNVVFANPGIREQGLRAISLLLLAGISGGSIESIVASGAGRDQSDIVEAANILLQAKLWTRLMDGDIEALGIALLKSRLPRAAFESIPPFLLKAGMRGLSDEVVGGLVVEVPETHASRTPGPAARPGPSTALPVGSPAKPSAPAIQAAGAGGGGGTAREKRP